MESESESGLFLSVVIPAYNEEDRLVPTIEETIDYLAKQHYSSEILVVSDGSHDNTAKVINRFKSPSRVKLLAFEYHPNRGKGYAVRYGMLRCKGAINMFMDADYAVPIQSVEKAWPVFEQGYDIVIASRALKGARIIAHQNFFRELSARVYTIVQNFYLGISYPDTQCGFKLYRKAAARRLFANQKLDSVIFDAELLWLAKKAGLRVGQFPVQWTHVENSRIKYDKLSKSLFIFRELLRIKRLHHPQ